MYYNKGIPTCDGVPDQPDRTTNEHASRKTPEPTVVHNDSHKVVATPAVAEPVPAAKVIEPSPHQNHGNNDLTPKQIDPNARRMTILTAIIAVAIIANVIVFYCESEDTSKQIGTLAYKTGGIVDAMNTALSNNREAVSKAFDANLKALESSEKQSKASLGAIIEQGRLDQRAWIGVGDPVFTFNTTVAPKAAVNAKNVGKTPADNIISKINWKSKPKGTDLALSDITYDTTDAIKKRSCIGTLFPSAVIPLYAQGDTVAPNQSDAIGTLSKGDETMHIFGEIIYTDAFGKQHWTHYCLIVERDLKNRHLCKIYNDTDTSSKQPN